MGLFELEMSGRTIRTDEKSLDHALHFQEQHLWGSDQTVLMGANEPPTPRTWAQIAVEQVSGIGHPEHLSLKQTYGVLASELKIKSTAEGNIMEALMAKSERTLKEEQNQLNASDGEVLDKYFLNHAKWLNEIGYLEPYLERKVNMNDPWDRMKAAHELKEFAREILRSPNDDHEFLRRLTHSLSVDLFANMGLQYLPYDQIQKHKDP